MVLNRIYIVVGLLAILALAGAFIAPRFIQWSDYRDRMEVLAEGVFGAEVTIRGDIDFALLPEPRLSFSDVVIGPEDDPAATVEGIEAEFALMDFLRDRYNLSALILKSPSMSFELDENGLFVSGVDLSGAGNGVALEQAHIDNGQLTLFDRRAESVYELSAINGDLRLSSFSGPFQFQGNANYGGTAYGLRLNSGVLDQSGATRVSAFISESPGQSSLTLDGMLTTGQAPKFDGTMVYRQPPQVADRADDIRGDLLLESKVTASTDRVVLNGYTLLLDENRAGMRLTGAASIQVGARKSFEAVVSGGVFSLPPRDANEDASQMPYEFVRLLSELPAPPMPPIPGEVGIDLAEIGLRGAALRNVRVDARTDGTLWTVTRAEAELPGNTELIFTGAVRNDEGRIGLNGNLDISTVRLDALTQLWRKPAEDTPLFNIPAELSGDLMLAGDALGFTNGRFTLNGKVHGLEVRFGFGDEPRLDLVGRFDDLGAGGSALLAAMLPDPSADPAFAISFPQGSFSLESKTIRLLGLDAQDMKAEGGWSSAGLNFLRLASSDWGGIAVDAAGSLAGTLAQPLASGSGRVEVTRADAPALTALYDFVAMPAPWRQSLARSAPAALDFELTPGDDTGAQRFTLNGEAGVARLDLALDMAGGLSGIAGSRVQLVGSLEAEDSAGLMRQLGLSSAPLFTSEGSALVSLFAEGTAENGFDARLSISQGEEVAAYSGEVSLLPDGQLTGTGTLDLTLADGSGLASLAGATGMGLGAFQASAGIEFYGAQSIAVTGIAGESAGTAFSGDLAVEQVAQRPSVEGALFFERLPGESLAAALFSPSALVSGTGVWPEGPLAVSTETRPTRGTIEVTASEIAWGESVLADASFDLVWDPQTLELSNLTGRIGEGTLTATLGKCCAGPLSERTVTGRVSLENVDVKAILPDSADAGLAARVSGSASFEGTGASLADVMSGLAGEGNLTLTGLSIDRLNPGVYPAIAALDDVLNTEAEALTVLIDQALGRGPFTAPSASGAFTIAGGTLRLANLIVEGEGARLAGGVSLALSDLGLDGSFVLTPFNYEDPTGLIENDSARVVTRLAGTLVEPEVSVDLTELVAAIQVRANELEVDRLEALRLEDEARQREAAEARNRLIEEQRRRRPPRAPRRKQKPRAMHSKRSRKPARRSLLRKRPST